MDHLHTIFHLLSRCIFLKISNELFLKCSYAFSCTPFVPIFHICTQYETLFQSSCHTFYKVVTGLFSLSCVSLKLFELPVLMWHATWLPFQLLSHFFSASFMFLFHLLFLAFILQTVHSSFVFSSFSHSLHTYSLYRYILLFLQLLHLQLMAQLILVITSQVFFSHRYISLKTYQSPSPHFPTDISYQHDFWNDALHALS